MYAKTFVGILALFLFHLATNADTMTPPPGTPGQPGIKVRLTRRVMSYVTQAIGHVMDALIPKVKVERLNGDFGVPLAHPSITRLRVTKYTKAQEYAVELIASNLVKIVVRNISLTAAFSYSSWGTLGSSRIESAGRGVGVVENLGAELLLALTQGAQSQLQATKVHCLANIVRFTLHLNETSGNGTSLIPTIRAPVEASMKDFLIGQLCERVTKLVSGELASELQRLTGVVALTKVDVDNGPAGGGAAEESKDDSLSPYDRARLKAMDRELQKAIQAREANLTIDMRLVRPPYVEPLFIETYHKGEISWHGAGDTTFFPTFFLPASKEATDAKMVYFRFSNYVTNSMISALYKHSALVVTANDRATASLAQSLRTTCTNVADNLCFGRKVPSAQRLYPNQRVELTLVPLSAPCVTIRDLVVEQKFEGNLTVRVKPLANSNVDKKKDNFTEQKQILSARVALTNMISPQVVGDRATLRMSFTRLTAVVQSTTLDKDEARNLFSTQDELSIPSIPVPLPALRFGRFVSPVITFSKVDNSVIVGVDLQIDERKLQSAAMSRMTDELKKLEQRSA